MFVPLYDDVEKKRPPIMTSILIALNLMVFVYQTRLLGDDPTGLLYMEFILKWGLQPVDLAKGNYLTIYTCMFLHAGFMHFLGNMIVLWAFSWTLEELLGPFRFLVLYLACGLAAGAAWCAFNWGGTIPCVGASGAIAGVMGAYSIKFGVSTKVRCMLWLFFRPRFFYMPTFLFAAVWVGMQLLGVMGSSTEEGGSGVAWWAHLGGFMAGLIMLPVLNENTRELTSDKDGSLSIVEQPSEEAPSLEPPVSEEPLPIVCLGCEAVLDDSHMIAPKLYRCPNTKCGRLNLDPKALPTKKKPAVAVRS
jgi:membrane associated rhomboid family serine protease